MAQSHPLSDMLTRIRNGVARQKATVYTSASKLNKHVLDVMEGEGYIRGYKVEKNEKNMDIIRVDLKYSDGQPAIRELKTVSKPGRRVYSSVKTMPRVHNGLGTSIVTTPKGVMTDAKARSENVGGEVLCQVF
jgi:small subunit ribosomal protein S8